MFKYHQHWQKYKKTAFEYLFTVVTTMRERVKAAKQPPLLVDVILKNKNVLVLSSKTSISPEDMFSNLEMFLANVRGAFVAWKLRKKF